MRIHQVLAGALKQWLTAKSDGLRYGSRRWTVLYLHEVVDPEPLKALLDEILCRYKVVSLSEGFRLTRSADASEPLFTLTFDDGDRTVWEHCLPYLRSRSIPACMFVCTSFVEAGFRDVSTGRYAVMSWDNLKEWVDAGLEVGAHTVNHIPLNQATFERAKWEILESKHVLEARLGCAVPHFAYPWGNFTDLLDDWLQQSNAFTTVCTTTPADNYPNGTGKRVCRKPAPAQHQALAKRLRNPTLYETVRAAHPRNMLTGLSPVLWRMDSK